jgi:hypothetical protein
VTTTSAVAHSRRSILRAVIRRSGPHVIEASVIPAVLFYGCLVGIGLHAAYLGVLAWSYGAFAVRVARGRPVPPLLVLTMIGISVRTVVAIISGSSFVYFVQPVLSTVAMSLVFLGSVVIGRPLIASLAHEFWPLTSEDVACPAVDRLFRNLTVLWAGVNLATAVTTMVLLTVLPLAAFVAVKQFTGLGITAVGVYITVSASLRMARRENLASLYPTLTSP